MLKMSVLAASEKTWARDPTHQFRTGTATQMEARSHKLGERMLKSVKIWNTDYYVAFCGAA